MAVADPRERIDVALDQVAFLYAHRRSLARTRADLITWALDVAGFWHEVETGAIARADGALREIARAEHAYFTHLASHPDREDRCRRCGGQILRDRAGAYGAYVGHLIAGDRTDSGTGPPV